MSVSSGSDLINDGWLKVNEDGTRDVLARAGLGEEGREGVVSSGQLVRRHVTVRLEIKVVRITVRSTK